MKTAITRRFGLIGWIVAILVLAFAVLQYPAVQAQISSLPSLPGGIKVPGVPSGKSGFSGLDALSAAKDLSGQQNKTSYPTPLLPLAAATSSSGGLTES